jgi:hypothetical protein
VEEEIEDLRVWKTGSVELHIVLWDQINVEWNGETTLFVRCVKCVAVEKDSTTRKTARVVTNKKKDNRTCRFMLPNVFFFKD